MQAYRKCWLAEILELIHRGTMSISRRLRTIYLSQLKALQERMEVLDSTSTSIYDEEESRKKAHAELSDIQVKSAEPKPAQSQASEIESAHQIDTPESISYKVLGLSPDAEMHDVEEAYIRLKQRCAPERFPEASEERKTAELILQRIEQAYKILRERLDATAGRFDRLEI
jgi:hypothetical protein